jgi:transposase
MVAIQRWRGRAMKRPLFIQSLSAEETRALEAGLRSRDAFTLRRAQILLASARGDRPLQIATYLGCNNQTVLNALHAFQTEGLACLRAKSSAPHRVLHAVWSPERDAELRELLHRSPRLFGKPRSTWTLPLLAEVCFEQGMTSREISTEVIRRTLKRLDINWQRAKHWMTSPDPHYARKKAARDRLIRLAASHPEWVLGFEDEVWWSRVAQPALRAWTDGAPMKVQLLTSDPSDPDPDAIACYGFLRHDTHQVMLRFVEGRPLGEVTVQFLAWLCGSIAQEGKQVLVVIWDEPSWHTADIVVQWVKEQNRRAERGEGVRVVVCGLPVASPWLNNIEPCWTHAKKAIMEVDRKLTAAEITHRVCEHFGCELLPYLKMGTAGDGVLTRSIPSPPARNG